MSELPGHGHVNFHRHNGNWTRPPYRFRLEYDPTDRYETNASFSEAKPIPGNETITAQIVPSNDEDYYSFVVESAGDVTLRVLSLPGGLAVRMSLFNEDQDEIDTWTTGSAAAETNALSAGLYYVRVHRHSGEGSLTPYTFRVEGAGVATAGEDGPGSESAALSAASPNPFRDTARLTLTVAHPERVTAAVYDVLGRRVALLHEGLVQPGAPLPLAINGAALAPGLYLVRVDGETTRHARTIIRTQ